MGNADETYVREQQKLQATYDGEDPEDGVRIPVPKEPEVNPEVYRDVLPLLGRGFLTVAATINDVLFVFKSLNHFEFELICLMGGFEADSPPPARFWDLFLAYGVFIVDGQNVLTDRSRWVPEIAKMFANLPRPAKQSVIWHMSDLNRRAASATVLTEAYATETYSRYRWAQVTGIDLMGPSLTGIQGTESLGLNYAQLTWRAINYYQDLNEEIERNWENAKFVGSCMAGKGISKVYSQDERRRKKAREEITARKDVILRQVLLGEKENPRGKQLGNAMVIAANTVEELAAQLEHDLRGEKDWHDRVVEAHETRVRTQAMEQQQKAQEMFEARKADFGDRAVLGGTELQGLSAAEVQQRVLRTKQLNAQAAAQRLLNPAFDEKSSNFHAKWGLSGSEVETKVTQTDRDPSDAVPIRIAPPQAPGRPFRRG